MTYEPFLTDGNFWKVTDLYEAIYFVCFIIVWIVDKLSTFLVIFSYYVSLVPWIVILPQCVPLVIFPLLGGFFKNVLKFPLPSPS